MTAITLITSTLALGTMIGISGTHYKQVQTMVEHGGYSSGKLGVSSSGGAKDQNWVSTDSASPVTLASTSSYVSASARVTTPVPATKAPRSKAHRPQKAPRPYVSTTQRDDALLEILVAIRNEQKNIKNQLSNTNRNMDELTFRVDSYSSQFRPLQTDPNARPRALVVPDNEFAPLMDSGMGGGLLPPKR